MPGIICYESDTVFDNVCISYPILYVMKIILQMMNFHCLGAMAPRSPSLYPPEFKLKLTKLNETSPQEMESRRNYDRNDRDANGGGVAIYVKDSLPEPIIELKSDKLELLSLRIKPKNAKSFIFVCWYRPPTSVVDDAAFENLRGILHMPLMNLLITSHLFHTDYFWHPECGPPSRCILYIFSCTQFYRAHSLDDHLQLTSTSKWLLLDLLNVSLYIYNYVFLCYASILTTHLHTIHTHLFLFTVDNIFDPEQSPSDSIDPIITQNNFIIPATQDKDDSQEAEGDLPEIHSNRSSTPSLEDHDDDLTNAQKNLLRDLTIHKTNILKHEGLANHFNTLSSSPGPALPNFTKPILNLRDQKFFSSTCLNKLDEINKEYQKQVCSLLGAHHTEMEETI